MELEITKAQLELAKIKSVSPELQTALLGQPRLLQAALTSTPGSALGSRIPTLEQLREKKKPGSTLPNNFVFSSKGTITYESIDFVNGFLEFQNQQPDACTPGLTKHLQLLMECASTYNWSSVCSFHLSIATAIDQGWLSWYDCDAIRERSQTFFTHQDLRTHPRTLGKQQNQSMQQSQLQRSNCDKENIATIGITPPNVIAIPPVLRVWYDGITPCCIVPKGNSLSPARPLTRIRLRNDKHS